MDPYHRLQLSLCSAARLRVMTFTLGLLIAVTALTSAGLAEGFGDGVLIGAAAAIKMFAHQQ